MLAHIVFFSLKDNSANVCQAMVESCKKYLTGHQGEVYFACGVRNPELSRELNDQEFDVALHIIFDSVANHDLYQEAPRHLEFVKENQQLWSGVRVFDSNCE